MSLFRKPQPSSARARIGRPTRTTTASAAPVDRGKGNALRKLSQAWQTRALGYYDTVGECWYPAQFYARSLAKVRLFPAILDERGDPQEVTEGPLVDLFERVQDPGGGRTELTGAYGRLMFLVGDGYMTVTGDEGQEQWEFLSPLELKINAEADGRQTYRRLRAPGLTPEELVEAPDDAFEALQGNQARVYRMWRRHPAHTEWADSPVKAVLELYELLSMLTLAAAAESKSRAASRGLFLVPEEVTFVSPETMADAGPDEDPDTDALMQEVTESAMNAIRNPGSAEAMSPIFIRTKGYYETQNGVVLAKEMLGHIPLGPDRTYAEAEMWDKTINRIALGLDMPKENVTGTADVNHWGGWLIDESGFRQHVGPMCQKLCDDITSAFLRPTAIEEDIPDADRAVVGYDPAGAVNHPDETATAKDAFDRLAISFATYRDRTGFTDDDAPDQEELDRRTLILLKQVPEDLQADDAGETAPQDGGRGADTKEGPPPNPNGAGDGEAVVAAAKMMGAAELAFERARELAGSRLANRSKGCDECREQLKDIPASRFAAALGRETVLGLMNGRASEFSLVAGAGLLLADKLTRWGADALSAKELSQAIEAHALRTLYDPSPQPLPAGFADMVARAVTREAA